jgi:hypothetical protein
LCHNLVMDASSDSTIHTFSGHATIRFDNSLSVTLVKGGNPAHGVNS